MTFLLIINNFLLHPIIISHSSPLPSPWPPTPPTPSSSRPPPPCSSKPTHQHSEPSSRSWPEHPPTHRRRFGCKNGGVARSWRWSWKPEKEGLEEKWCRRCRRWIFWPVRVRVKRKRKRLRKKGFICTRIRFGLPEDPTRLTFCHCFLFLLLLLLLPIVWTETTLFLLNFSLFYYTWCYYYQWFLLVWIHTLLAKLLNSGSREVRSRLMNKKRCELRSLSVVPE